MEKRNKNLIASEKPNWFQRLKDKLASFFRKDKDIKEIAELYADSGVEI